jgi:hypothetical protein
LSKSASISFGKVSKTTDDTPFVQPVKSTVKGIVFGKIQTGSQLPEGVTALKQ